MQKPTFDTTMPGSAFLNTGDQSDQHIIDTMIEERCPSFVEHWSWPAVRPLLYAALKYKTARNLADIVQDFDGRTSFDYLADQLAVNLNLYGQERVPRTGRVIITANHPTGLADGIAVWDAVRQIRRDVVFMANADAIRVNPDFTDIIIPVEWVQEKRTPQKTRETLTRTKQALSEGKCVIIFPSGRLAKRIEGKLTEQEWMSSAVSLARKYDTQIQPLNVSAENSKLFYLLSAINGQLRDITLFNELLNKKNSRFGLNFGPLIDPNSLIGDANAVTVALRDYVSTDLGQQPDEAFGREQ